MKRRVCCLPTVTEPVIYDDTSMRDRRDFLTKQDWKTAWKFTVGPFGI